MNPFTSLLREISRRRILVIGDVMLDHYCFGDATRISPEAPVPVVNVSSETDTVGGAANVAHNIATLGAKVEVLGGIGDDANGVKLRQHLTSNRITFDARFLLRGARTITKTRVIVRNQQLCRLDHEEGLATYREVLSGKKAMAGLEKKIAAADGVILSDYAKGVLTTERIAEITRLVRKQGKFIALDPKPSSGNTFDDLDLITPNRHEAFELAGTPSALESESDLSAACASIWRQFHPRNLVVTLGADGMLISRGGKVGQRIPTAARQVYDVSGAGDTVIAALTLALTSGASLEDAAHFANAAAGVVVAKLGTATVTPQELADYVST
jgi:rfaE bifunctional protein kinase chain/domain